MDASISSSSGVRMNLVAEHPVRTVSHYYTHLDSSSSRTLIEWWKGEVPPQKWMNFYTKVL